MAFQPKMRWSADGPPRGSGNGRLAAAVVAMAPALAATYGQALVVRRRFARNAAVHRALDRLGLSSLARGRHMTVSILGSGKSNAVVAVELTGGDAPATKLVVKRALPFGTLMAWGARNFGANYVYAPHTRGAARITREAAALRFLATRGIAVPRCLAASADDELIALEWIEGSAAATALHGPRAHDYAVRIGELLRRVHDAGVTLGDGHPGNMLIERDTDRLVLFDLEFAECSGSTPARRGFDLAYAAILMPTPPLREAMIAAYGARTRDEHDAFTVAERHLASFGRLVEMERARWAPR